jgi:hypothetical protein
MCYHRPNTRAVCVSLETRLTRQCCPAIPPIRLRNTHSTQMYPFLLRTTSTYVTAGCPWLSPRTLTSLSFPSTKQSSLPGVRLCNHTWIGCPFPWCLSSRPVGRVEQPRRLSLSVHWLDEPDLCVRPCSPGCVTPCVNPKVAHNYATVTEADTEPVSWLRLHRWSIGLAGLCRLSPFPHISMGSS